ncbi:hypothetical protein [Acidithiobacillus sp.]|uniref:hypothetical protein n=1 Tax=Acidithiobacillus sp. TaxID=1872118 RepID=UPI003CFCA74B
MKNSSSDPEVNYLIGGGVDFRVLIGRTCIDYDPNKEQINRKHKHYSLESAAYLLQRLVLPIPSPLFMTKGPFEENGEIRHNHMTLDDNGNVLFFVTTMRPGETVRVISLRPASHAEKALYFTNANAP